jgi:tRNA threonylcarbamoyladenosine biosynthesis protein TsaB
MLILSIDTCLGACSCAVVKDGEALASAFEPMARGHQERLAPMVEATMKQAGVAFADLDRIVVTVGPGSFTGLRVGLAFAKGLGLALERPVVGVGVLDALAFGTCGLAAAVIDARRDQVYVRAFRDGQSVGPAQALSVEDAVEALAAVDPAGPAIVTGPGAALLAGYFPRAEVLPRAGPDPLAVAALAAAVADPAPPRPIYLRAPDAKLPASAVSA